MQDQDAALVELVNSGPALDEPGWLERALDRWGLPAGRPLTDGERAALRSLRDLLHRLATVVGAGRPLAAEELDELNAVLGAVPVRARLEPTSGGGYYVEMTPAAASWEDLVVRELAGAFGSLLRRSTPPRLKVCENTACGLVFVDESRNRTRRWCDSAGCGNRIRVRRHRARARA